MAVETSQSSNRALKDTEDVLMQVMAPMEKHLSGVVFRDAYCIGFLQTVAIHTATESLKQHSNGSVPAEKAMAVFEQGSTQLLRPTPRRSLSSCLLCAPELLRTMKRTIADERTAISTWDTGCYTWCRRRLAKPRSNDFLITLGTSPRLRRCGLPTDRAIFGRSLPALTPMSKVKSMRKSVCRRVRLCPLWETCAAQNGMSALPPKADMCSAQADVC